MGPNYDFGPMMRIHCQTLSLSASLGAAVLGNPMTYYDEETTTSAQPQERTHFDTFNSSCPLRHGGSTFILGSWQKGGAQLMAEVIYVYIHQYRPVAHDAMYFRATPQTSVSGTTVKYSTQRIQRLER